MWPDNETDRDFLNFTGVAETVAEIIVQAEGRPISIGMSGAWGVGKSSMIKLVRHSLEQRIDGESRDFVFVEFNAWLYQGYDDARAALMEVIGATLVEEAEKRKKGTEKAWEFVQRIRWFRLAKLFVGSAAAMHAGLPPIPLFHEIANLGQHFFGGHATSADLKEAGQIAAGVRKEASSLLKPKEVTTPPKEIHALRESFEQTLVAMGVTLVVLIDDLDRCLPETTISTLEAIRLFLFLKHTAFVIAADDELIKNAVRKHFEGITDNAVVTSYFDKLIQVPIRVPPLGTQEVRAYMMLLFIENSSLPAEVKEKLRSGICTQLSQTWQGKRADRAFITSLHDNFENELLAKLETADRLAHMMTTASGIAGNPRLIKRFLNALAIRMAISRAHGVGVDEAVLVKMMLFERVGNSKAYAELAKAVSESADGKAAFLKEWEDAANEGKELNLTAPWDDAFVREWLTLSPRLADQDLRGVLYVSREHAPLITPQDRLSSDAADILTALVDHPGMAGDLKDQLSKIPRKDISTIMDRLLDLARREQAWGTPDILEACIVAATADPTQGPRLAAFLSERPASQIRADIIPKIADQPWSKAVMDKWEGSAVTGSVKRAIQHERKN